MARARPRVAILARVVVASGVSREPHDQIMTGRRDAATALSGGGPHDAAAARDADLHAGRYVGLAGFGREQSFDGAADRVDTGVLQRPVIDRHDPVWATVSPTTLIVRVIETLARSAPWARRDVRDRERHTYENSRSSRNRSPRARVAESRAAR